MMSSSITELGSASTEGNRSTSRLNLVFDTAPGGVTFVKSQFAEYPFHVCRPHYLDRALPRMATLYLQSCSGGLFEDDDLNCTITAEAGAAVHVTSQASTIVHSSRHGRSAVLRTKICAQSDAIVEYMPDCMILFPESRLATRLDISLQPSATVIVSDAFILHDPNCKNRPPAALEAAICARSSEGRLLAADRIALFGNDLKSKRPGIMGAWNCHATLMLFTMRRSAADLCQALRAAAADFHDIYCGVSELPNRAGAWVRMLSADAVSLRSAMQAIWIEGRRLVTGDFPDARRK